MKKTKYQEPEEIELPHIKGKPMQAPFETFPDYAEREAREDPYNETFLNRCREKALEYDKLDVFLRPYSLACLVPCIPFHFRNKVFDGISIPTIRRNRNEV